MAPGPAAGADERELILTAPLVLPVSSSPLWNGDPSRCAHGVRVSGDRLVVVGTREDVLAGAPPGSVELPLPGAAILPGLVNTHTHLELTGLGGMVQAREFVPWLWELVRGRDALAAEDRRMGAIAGAMELAAGGVTTCADTASSTAPIVGLDTVGLRGIVHLEGIALAEAEVDEQLARLRRRLEEARELARGSRVRPGLSPHAPYSVCPGLYRGLLALAEEERVPLAVHLAESRAEVDFLRDGSGPFAELYRSRGLPWSPPGCSPVAYLERLGVLAADPLIIHAVQLTETDVDRLARVGSRVAHCPRSNAYLHQGAAPLGELQRAGLRVGLGTDGAACNHDLDLLAEARFAWLAQGLREPVATPPPVDADALLRLVTLDGARALALEEELGSLEAGKLADLAVLSLPAGARGSSEDPCRALMEGASARDVLLTMVGGEVVYERGVWSRVESEEVHAALADQRRRLQQHGVS